MCRAVATIVRTKGRGWGCEEGVKSGGRGGGQKAEQERGQAAGCRCGDWLAERCAGRSVCAVLDTGEGGARHEVVNAGCWMPDSRRRALGQRYVQ